MASPAFRAAGTGVFPANNIPNPSTLACTAPAGRVSGDLILCITWCRSITATVSTPANWNLVSGFPKRSGTASGGSVYVFSRIADGTSTDNCSPSWSGPTTGTSGDSSGAVIIAWSGLTETLDGTIQTSDLAAQTTTSVIPAFTTGTNNSLVIGIAMKLLESSGQTSTVATFTERYDGSTTSGTGHVEEVSDKALTGVSSAGSSGTATVTWSATTSARALTVSLGFKSVMLTGAAAENLTITLSGAGVRKTFGAASTPETLTFAAAGVRTRFGVASTPLAATITAAGTVTTPSITGAADEPLALTITAAGVRTRLGAAARSLTATIAAAGQVTVNGAAASNLTLTETAAGQVTVPGAASEQLDLAVTASGLHTGQGAAARNLTATLTAAGYVTHAGSAASTLSLAVNAAGTRSTFSASSTPLSAIFAAAGTRTTFGTAAFDETLTIFASASGPHGQAGMALGFNASAAGIRTTFASSASTFTLTESAAGSRGLFAAADSSLTFQSVTAGYATHTSPADLPLVLTVTAAGVRQGEIIGGPVTNGTIAEQDEPALARSHGGHLASSGQGGIAG